MTTASPTEAAVKRILAKPYTRRLTPDEAGGFTATIQEFPGCIAEGDTADEALRNLEAAAASWLEVSLAHGREVRDPISFDGNSGKIALRIPRGLHRQVSELAEIEECSVNQLLTAAIASYVGQMQAAKTVGEAIRAALPAFPALRLVAGAEGSGARLAGERLAGAGANLAGAVSANGRLKHG